MQLIYRLTSPSGKVYIGQTKNLKARLSCYRTLKCKAQSLLFNSLKKYGFEAHVLTILHRFPDPVTQSVIDDYERYAIRMHLNMRGVELLNLTRGGSGNGFRGGQQSRPRPDVQGANHPNSKLTEADVRDMRQFYRRGVRGRGLRQIAQLWNVHLRLAFNVVNNRTWKHVNNH